ncbi:hypothetical protein GCM10027256_35560 [Novispirillum itersonii subsp. nipponicum]
MFPPLPGLTTETPVPLSPFLRPDAPALDPATLMDIIALQGDIARLGPELGSVMALVTDRMLALTGATGAVIELAEGEEMVYRAASGMAQEQLGLRLAAGNSLSGLSVRSNSILRCDDSETDTRANREACRAVGLRSMVVCPLTHGTTGTTPAPGGVPSGVPDGVIGVLKLISPTVSAFDGRTEYILRLVSDMIAAAMFHAARFETSQLYHMATHDALTGLPNRALFHDRLRQGLEQARRTSAALGVLILDMDGLKTINDTLGHAAGDAALREAASRIRDAVTAFAVAAGSTGPTVARLGGDEFGILSAPLEDPAVLSAKAERVADALDAPFHFDSATLPLGCSIGQAVFPKDADIPDALIHTTDQRMYQHKRSRKGDKR